MKAITGGKIILKDRIVENCVLLYTDKIEGIVPAHRIPVNAEIIDANGGYVAPGLIDLHIHGYLGKDVFDGEEESIRTISKGLLERAQEVLDKEFPELSKKIKLHIPDEKSRRVGQSVAAASLPKIK